MALHKNHWTARLDSYNNAFSKLECAISEVRQRPLSPLEKLGTFHLFELTFDLACNTIGCFLESQGETGIYGPRDVIRLAFRRGLLEDGATWMDMLKTRTLTSHTYNADFAEQAVDAIVNRYYPAFAALRDKLEALKRKEERA